MRSLLLCLLVAGAAYTGYCTKVFAEGLIDSYASLMTLWQLLPLETKCLTLRLLFVAFLTVPIYSAILFMIGLHLFMSALNKAQLLLATPYAAEIERLEPTRAAPPPPFTFQQCQQESVPKPTPPPRKKRKLVNPTGICPSSGKLSVSTLQRRGSLPRQFKTLRRDLLRVFDDPKPLSKTEATKPVSKTVTSEPLDLSVTHVFEPIQSDIPTNAAFTLAPQQGRH